jgi:hypothetical protein
MNTLSKTVGLFIQIIGVIMIIIGIASHELAWSGFGSLTALIGRVIAEYF